MGKLGLSWSLNTDSNHRQRAHKSENDKQMNTTIMSGMNEHHHTLHMNLKRQLIISNRKQEI